MVTAAGSSALRSLTQYSRWHRGDRAGRRAHKSPRPVHAAMAPMGGAPAGGSVIAHAADQPRPVGAGCPRYLAPHPGTFRSPQTLCLRGLLSDAYRAASIVAWDRVSSEKIGCLSGATHSQTPENGWFRHRHRCSANNIALQATPT